MKQKRFVLSGYFGFKNFGDEAILSVLVERLKLYKHRITVISSDPVYTKSKFKHIRSVYTFNPADLVAAIAKSDILISGGGSLLQDATSVKSLMYYLFVIFVALVLRKQVIIFAQGIGPIDSFFGALFTRILLKHCKYVSVRDKKSFDLLKSWGINSDLLCDPIFSTVVDSSEKKNVVAVQLRNFKTMNEDFIDRLAQKVLKEFPEMSIEVYSLQDSIDIEPCEKFVKAVKLLNSDADIRMFSNLTDSEIVDKISKAKYLISMRFHAIIVGLLSGAKTMAINYDIKIGKISSEFDLPVLDLYKPFDNSFSQLKNQDSETISKKVLLKNFDWTNFDKAINSD